MRSLCSRQLKKCLYETLIIMNQYITIGGTRCYNCYERHDIDDLVRIEYPICQCVHSVCKECNIGLLEFFKKIEQIDTIK